MFALRPAPCVLSTTPFTVQWLHRARPHECFATYRFALHALMLQLPLALSRIFTLPCGVIVNLHRPESDGGVYAWGVNSVNETGH